MHTIKYFVCRTLGFSTDKSTTKNVCQRNKAQDSHSHSLSYIHIHIDDSMSSCRPLPAVRFIPLIHRKVRCACLSKLKLINLLLTLKLFECASFNLTFAGNNLQSINKCQCDGMIACNYLFIPLSSQNNSFIIAIHTDEYTVSLPLSFGSIIEIDWLNEKPRVECICIYI